MIDSDGFRPNVGIILSNLEGKVFWARRCGQDAWQFPQGGIQGDETPSEAMYRELFEETGLLPEHVELISSTSEWLRYRLPKRMIRKNTDPVCIGQKQIWFILRMLGNDADFNLNAMENPEFDHWCWVDYWQPMDEVVFFKRKVYQKALAEFEHLVISQGKTKERGKLG
ncbi:MAG: RNA pyrophosphohydrolase [Gammaproteobacteria bacterium]|nr:RNA pyrophosphohydrolase [Gammaproteobacteria bacterium]